MTMKSPIFYLLLAAHTVFPVLVPNPKKPAIPTIQERLDKALADQQLKVYFAKLAALEARGELLKQEFVQQHLEGFKDELENLQ